MSRPLDARARRARASPSPARNQRVDLGALATAILRERQAAEPARPVAVTISPGLEVMGDARLLDRLMSSLLDNAWKYTRQAESPRIELTCQVRGGGTGYQVRGNGRG